MAKLNLKNIEGNQYNYNLLTEAEREAPHESIDSQRMNMELD